MSSRIELRREIFPSRMLKRDGAGNLSETVAKIELRFDPLTGRSCRLHAYSLSRIIRPDLALLERRSRERPCPFCKPLIEQVTPRFSPDFVKEGFIRRGKAFAFPNADPYDIYGVVVVISDEHFIPLDRFDGETVMNAFLAAQTHIRTVQQADPEAKYAFIAWNYMPPSGASIVHPHLQSNAGYYPTNYQRELLEGAQRYFQEKGSNYFHDLFAQEKALNERYIGSTGSVVWLTAFAPRGRLSDIIAIFPEKASITELTEGDWRDFTDGLLKVFRYIDRLNLASFNLSTYSGFDAGQFWTHVRITPRGLLLYSPIETSDQFYYQIMHDENICILPPEEAAARLRQLF